MQIELDGKHISVEVRRSARARWARLEIHLHRGLRVTLPDGAPAADAEKLLRSKSAWILRHHARFERLRKIVPDRRYVSGERLPYFDESLTLEITTGPARVERRGGTLVVAGRSRRKAVEGWYFAQAQAELSRLAVETAARQGISIRGVRISRAKTRWGSCSSTGWINLNWRLMLAPSRIVDYLIAHELAHVAHKNHSPAFWSRVAELHPAYAESERWLRKNGAGLVL